MPGTFTINITRPLQMVEILNARSRSSGANLSGENGLNLQGDVNLPADLENQETSLSQVCQILKGLAEKLNQSCEKLFTEHKDEIAKLAIEIARKILMQKVSDKDYEIESIIKEAIKSAPTRQDIVAHLNPEDFIQCQKFQQDDAGSALAGIKFVSDPDIGRAECVLATPKGIIRSLISEHLDRIGKAMNAAE